MSNAICIAVTQQLIVVGSRRIGLEKHVGVRVDETRQKRRAGQPDRLRSLRRCDIRACFDDLLAQNDDAPAFVAQLAVEDGVRPQDESAYGSESFSATN